MANAPPQRTRDAERTREEILAAAQEAFSVRGYSDTGVRDITAAVGVNPSLVSRYFGSKERLFEAALSQLLNAQLITDLPRERFGEAVMQILTSTRPGQRNPLPMMLLASADPVARAISARLLKNLFAEPLAKWFGPECGAGKAACFSLLASGLTLYRELYPLAAVGAQIDDVTRAWLTNAFQSLVNE